MTSASFSETHQSSVPDLTNILSIVEQTGVRSTALTTNFGPSTRFVESDWKVAPVFRGRDGLRYTLLCVERLTAPTTASSVITFPTQEREVRGKQAIAHNKVGGTDTTQATLATLQLKTASGHQLGALTILRDYGIPARVIEANDEVRPVNVVQTQEPEWAYEKYQWREGEDTEWIALTADTAPTMYVVPSLKMTDCVKGKYPVPVSQAEAAAN